MLSSNIIKLTNIIRQNGVVQPSTILNWLGTQFLEVSRFPVYEIFIFKRSSTIFSCNLIQSNAK